MFSNKIINIYVFTSERNCIVKKSSLIIHFEINTLCSEFYISELMKINIEYVTIRK